MAKDDGRESTYCKTSLRNIDRPPAITKHMYENDFPFNQAHIFSLFI